jgi:transcriptional regulator with AAA-type ATPase domain
LFEELKVPSDGIDVRPGMTFVVGDKPHRYIAIDGAMRKHHPTLLDILGTEDEVRDNPELVSPSDFILAADSGGHMLITGKPGCGQDELAHIAHKISKRRASPFVVHDDLPRDLEAQNAFVKDDLNKSTLLLRVGENAPPFDPSFLSMLFSSSYQIRVIVLARTVEVASEALGAEYLQPLMQVALRPLAERRAAIHPLIDRWLAAHGSPLRIADLTPLNQHALLVHEWRDNLVKLRETAERLDAIVRAPSLNQARKRLRIARNTFYSWFGDTLGLSDPLVSKERAPALRAALVAQPHASAIEPASEHELTDDDDPANEA